MHTVKKNTGNGREIPSKERLSRQTSTNYRNNSSNSRKIKASHCEERVQEPGRILGNRRPTAGLFPTKAAENWTCFYPSSLSF